MIIILMTISGITLFLSVMVGLSTFGMLGPITGKYFDVQFKKKRKPLPYMTAIGFSRRCHRGMMYSSFILFNGNPFINHTSWFSEVRINRFNNTWGLVNYRKLARKRDWILAVSFWSAMLLVYISFISGIILGALMKHYGIT